METSNLCTSAYIFSIKPKKQKKQYKHMYNPIADPIDIYIYIYLQRYSYTYTYIYIYI